LRKQPLWGYSKPNKLSTGCLKSTFQPVATATHCGALEAGMAVAAFFVKLFGQLIDLNYKLNVVTTYIPNKYHDPVIGAC